MKLSQLSNEDPTAKPAREAEAFCQRIRDMLDDGKYHWAEDTLLGIHETVSKAGRVTDGQKRAIDNIENHRRRK